jgi:hypothetical protein
MLVSAGRNVPEGDITSYSMFLVGAVTQLPVNPQRMTAMLRRR